MDFTNELKNKVLYFAEATDDMNAKRYERRGQFDKTKRIKDKILGTYGELIINDVLEADCQESIFKIGIHGSYVPDVSIGDTKISVKTQSYAMAEKYGRGWVFEKNDSIFSPERNTYTHIGALVIKDYNEVNNIKEYIDTMDKWTIDILCISPVEIMKYALVPMALEKHRKGKIFLKYDKIRPEHHFVL